MTPSHGPLALTPQTFGQDPSGPPVELLQTHIGWVYLVGAYAFKLKKQVKYDFLDFTALSQRQWACTREVILNRRLCPELYIGLVPVLRSDDGRTFIDPRYVLLEDGSEAGFDARLPEIESRAGARIVDWAVWMRRLPAERMLDRMLAAGAVTVADAAAIAAILGDFYRRQRGQVPPGGLGDLAAVRVNVEENLREGAQLDRAALSAASLALIERRARHFLNRHGELIQRRAADGFVVDGHGDLRAENICLPAGQPPLLFDCIEFNDRFRICDSALDAAFLAMDFDARGRGDLSRALLEHYQAACDPQLPPRLLNFYQGYRAFVKGKVCAWIAADVQVEAAQREHARVEAVQFFDLAVRYALQGEAVLFVFCGMAGSGKSTLAADLSRRLNAAHFATDLLRKEIVPRGLPPEERYAPAQSYRVYRALLERGAEVLQKSQMAVLDGTFTRKSIRAEAAQMAAKHGARAILVWADCPPERIAAHLEERRKAGALCGSEAGAAISERQRAAFSKPSAREGFSAVCRIDTGASLDSARAAMWEAVLAALMPALPSAAR